MKIRKSLVGAAVSALLLSTGTAFAADPSFGSNTLRAQPSVQMSNMTLTVTGPNGYHAKEFSAFQAPSMSLAQKGVMADGLYKWELTGATSQRELANPMGLNNGRGAAEREFASISMTESGSFRVVNGSIAAPDTAAEEPASFGKK